MQCTAQVFISFVKSSYVIFSNFLLNLRHVVVNDTPYAVQEAEGTFNTLIAPIKFSFRRSSEENEETSSISTIFAQNFFRRNYVAERFTHFSAVFDYHTLSQQVGERFIVINQASITQYFQEEARIEQVEDCVFDTADVLVNRAPVVVNVFSKR